jgi:hypothetical protein
VSGDVSDMDHQDVERWVEEDVALHSAFVVHASWMAARWR